MFTISVPERMIAEKPNNLGYLENLTWDYFFRDKGWYIFCMEDTGEGYLILDDTANLEHAFFQCEMASVRFWLFEEAVQLIKNNELETIKFYTYPNVFNDDDTENVNYDYELRSFEVPVPWFLEFILKEWESVEQFFDEFTYDDTWWIYEQAIITGNLISEKIVER